MRRRFLALLVVAAPACFADDPSPIGSSSDGDSSSSSGTSTSAGTTTASGTGTTTLPTTTSGTGPPPTSTSSSTMTTAGVSSGPATSTGDVACPTGHFDSDGACARYIFVSADRIDSDMMTRIAADSLCSTESGAELGVASRALINFGDVAQMWDHVDINALDGPFVLPDSSMTVVATGPAGLRADLSAAPLLAPISVGADGDVVTAMGAGCVGTPTGSTSPRVWTGMLVGDDVAEPAGTCQGWDSNIATPNELGGAGDFQQAGPQWLGGSAQCNCTISSAPRPLHLYCIEEIER